MKTKYTPQSDPVKILRRLQQFGYKSAIIAGGAIRDDYTGESISDYDIFLWDPRQSNEFDRLINPVTYKPRLDVESACFEQEQTSWFTSLLNADIVEQIFMQGGYAGGPTNGDGDALDTPGIGSYLTSIWEAEVEYDTYQLIYTPIKPVDHVNKHFDIGLCKAYCDGDKIRYTQDFLRDVRDKTFTICGQGMTPESFEYCMEYHIDKLEWKYPSFTTKVAPHNQKLYDDYLNS